MSITHSAVSGPLVELTDYQAAHSIANGTITEAMQVLADNATGNVSTTAHGYAPKAPNDATKFLDGTGAYSTPAGGGFTHSYLGYNTIGGSTEALTALRVYTKQVTPASNGLLLSVGFYFNMGAGDHVPGLAAGVWADNSTAPGQLLAFNNTQQPSFLPEAALGTPTSRWIQIPVTYYAAASTPIWIGVMFLTASAAGTIAYDTGTDQFWTVSGGNWISDGGSLYTITTSARKYSIRADFIS